MLEDVVGSFLDAVGEREFDAPFIALLRSHGYSKIHLVHGQFEFGKDVIAQREEPHVQFAFQTKAGDIALPQWSSQVRGQVEILRFNDLVHPDYDTDLPREGVLVLTGRLVGGAALEIQNYKQRIDRKRVGGPVISRTPLIAPYVARRRALDEPGFDVWDRERLVELLTASPEAGLTGFSDGPLLELLGGIDQGAVGEARLERFAERWIGGANGIEWRALLEASIVANRLRRAERLDLACFTALCVVRAVWASVHATEPPPDVAVAQRDTAFAMFKYYAAQVWDACSDELLTPAGLRGDAGLVVTYPVSCMRLLEVLGLLGLSDESVAADIADWLLRFVKAQPGASHPLSDRWAVSLLPAVMLLAKYHRDQVPTYLTEVIRWLGDRHDNGELGLAGPHAEPVEEVEYVLGSALDHIERSARRSSYLAAVLLDLAALLEEAELYDLAFNEITALDITPFLTIPRDDASQYLATGHGVDVPINTSPNYREYFAHGEEWRMASHHDDVLARYYLGRVDRPWDYLALSIVCRDRHWVAALRALIREENGTEGALADTGGGPPP